MLKTDQLKAYYSDFQALFGVDITVEEGEIVAIIGANGAGKSTIMRAVTGLLPCEPDMVQWRGNSIGHWRADQVAELGISMVPEGRQLFPSLSVEENLLIGGRSKRTGKWSLESVYELFPVLGQRRSQASTSLSGGQQQLAAIGRALMSNPDIILFDEISLGLAPIVIQQLYEAMPEIISEGVSAVIVEQDINKAVSIAHRVYCLSEGRVALQGKSNELGRDEIAAAYFGI
ncbi:MAG: ABC transporter ATP-binding protein [Gammaproteobacteria bacterium]|nr:ABC transporter ATP-binding protein [Gammaproteobacteria bacterium]